ncbi:MAG TPA: glycosyltransferase family 2 protein [Rickettsiales bacterium]|nr:glycosyltransferase family 2 protein [Rickettsiales bacterium]
MDTTHNPTIDVSVIIAAYNVENYIRHAIRSALDQEHVRVEVIVVDDCSRDRTGQIVQNMRDPRVRYIRLTRNAGAGAARNAAIAAAQGKWIAILDGDDRMLPGRLARCIEHAALHHADIVVDNIVVQREQDGREFLMFPTERFTKMPYITLADFIAGNQSFLGGYCLGYLKPIFSAHFLQRMQLAYRPEIRIGEDYMLMAEALANQAVCVTEPTAGYAYTARAGSTSHRLRLEDVNRIATADRLFLTHHTLDPRAAAAQQRRERHLQQAYRFTQLVDALKCRDLKAALKIVLSSPQAAWPLWRPACVRIQRLWSFS